MDNQTADYLEFVKIQNALASNGYEIDSRLAKGVISQVYKAKFKDDGNTYALKVTPFDENNSGKKKYQERELQLLTKMKLAETPCPNVIKYFKSWIVQVSDGKRLCIQMELCSLNLAAFISQNKSGPAIIKAKGPPRFYHQVFEQILNGLVFIHSIDWVHRDIHPGNILIANPNPKHISDIHVKIADFGLARHVGIDLIGIDASPTHWTVCERYEKLTPLSSTNAFTAPEIQSATYDFTADVYSAAVVLYFISRYPLVQDPSDLKKEVEEIKEGKLDVKTHIHHKDDEKLYKVLNSILKNNANGRPSAGAVKEFMFPKGDTPTNVEFFARRDDEDLTPCSLNKLTVSALKEAVENVQEMFQSDKKAKEIVSEKKSPSEHSAETTVSEEKEWKFFIQKDGELAWNRWSVKGNTITMPKLEEAIELFSHIKPECQQLRQKMTLPDGTPGTTDIHIKFDEDVREMFQSAEDTGKKIYIIVSEKVTGGKHETGDSKEKTFLVAKYGQPSKRCSLKGDNLTLSSLKAAIECRIDVKLDSKNLVQATTLMDGTQTEITIESDEDVQKMFQGADEKGKEVCIVLKNKTPQGMHT